MKLIAVLFLCSRLLPSLTEESFSQEIDCNDEDLFKAVDTALKKYNSRNQSGNQFVLYRVTEVTRTDDPETFYSFKYQIREGDCSVQSDKTWQDCDYKESTQAATGECSATVGKRGNTKFSVATQTCQITPAEGPVVTSQYDCLGCVHPISTASLDLEPVLRHAIQHFNNHTGRSHLFALREVKRAHRQVVAGWNYEITYSIVQTNCSKEHFLFLTPDCKSLLNGDIGECTDHAHVDLQLRIASLSQKCELYPGEDFIEPPPSICPGCPKEIPVNSPELEVALNHSTAKLNAENNGTFYFKIDHVKSATVQVVAGKKFSIEFIARETTCSKESNEELTESCNTNKFGKILDCKAEVYVIPWEKKIYPTVHCQSRGETTLMKRPPGFSPFRSVQVEKTKEGTTVSPPHTSMASVQDEEQDSGKEQGPTRGRGWGHGKQIKHGFGHGHKHEHDQGHRHNRGRGLGHGHQKQHGFAHGHQKQHGLGHGHQQELDYDLEHQGRHGLGHGHQRGRGLAHGRTHEHGHGHGKYKNKRKDNEKDNGWKIEHLASSSEDSTTSSAQTQEKTEGPTPLPPLAQPGIAVTLPDFQDSDLIAAVMSNTPPTPTESDDDWIPDIQIEKNSLSFNLIPDFPEKTSPKCPGRPWKPVNGMNPTVEIKEFHDFDLSDALY
ncbi:kininogen-1 isoform X2 [Lynx canadensis]|uniref:kininogen-1 isoform X2 n=1 Tax=Lynx canadensis TaxID=61383 RepID=UPI0011B0EAE4|nr:kininogen-1 isoform X2 [Lynx canadensis]